MGDSGRCNPRKNRDNWKCQSRFTFAEMQITEKQDMFNIDQGFYMNKIEQTSNEAEFSKFAYMRMKLECLANARPDLAFEISRKHK